jgi:hypothetical protein
MEGRTIVDAEEEADAPVGVDPYEHEMACATTNDVRQAIQSLTQADKLRLRKAAATCLAGSDYASPDDLINEAIRRTMDAAEGLRGRKWPLNVPFVAYMVNTMKGLASDSKGSAKRRDTVSMQALTPEGADPDETLGALLRADHRQADIATALIDRQEAEDLADAEERDLAALDECFANDEQVQYVIMGIKDGMKPDEVCAISEMTQTQYETARRRYRRGLEKLFPGRRK